jgi:hypothetical protein
VFTVSLLNSPTGRATVHYKTADGTATVGTDYSSATGILRIKNGGPVKVMVKVKADLISDPNEWFMVVLEDVQGATLADNVGYCTIQGG